MGVKSRYHTSYLYRSLTHAIMHGTINWELPYEHGVLIDIHMRFWTHTDRTLAIRHWDGRLLMVYWCRVILRDTSVRPVITVRKCQHTALDRCRLSTVQCSHLCVIACSLVRVTFRRNTTFSNVARISNVLVEAKSGVRSLAHQSTVPDTPSQVDERRHRITARRNTLSTRHVPAALART